MTPRFLQIHTLHPYTSVFAQPRRERLPKRLPYGGVSRTRVSSQCLKRHWRTANDPRALDRMSVPSIRSRDLAARILAQARSSGVGWSDEVAEALLPWFQFAVYGTRPEDAPSERGQQSKFDEKRQPLLFGLPEIEWLGREFSRLMADADGNADRAFELAGKWVNGKGKAGSRKSFLANMQALRDSTQLPAGLTAALFGRFVTSDPAADITAPVYVAHAFTVHAEEAEMDYFAAVDDLMDSELSAATVQEAELTSGLFYGYAVVDIPALAANLGEDLPDAPLTGDVLYNLVHLVAEVSPGARQGSTAPFSRASLMLLEAGDRQPRSLAEAYRSPCAPDFEAAAKALAAHLGRLDDAYATGEQRRVLSLADVRYGEALPGSLAELADWARGLPPQLS